MRHLPRQERCDRIIAAAMRVFATSGFKGTRTKDLARAAKVSEGLLFKFFPDKKALQKAIIEERIRQSGESLPSEVLGASPDVALTAIARRVISLCDRDPTFMRLLYFSALEGEPLAPMFFRRRVAKNIQNLSGLIGRWKSRGLVRRSLDEQLTAWTFMAALYQLMVSRHIFGVRRMEDKPGDLASKIVDLFIRGIRP